VCTELCVRVCGVRGSVIAKIVGRNVIEHKMFVQHVPLWVKEELFNGKKLTDIINSRHENIKYLPGCVIPFNVVSPALSYPLANPDPNIKYLPGCVIPFNVVSQLPPSGIT